MTLTVEYLVKVNFILTHAFGAYKALTEYEVDEHEPQQIHVNVSSCQSPIK